MAELTVDLTYGNALFQAAVETGKRDQIQQEGFALVELFQQNPDLYELIHFPAISAGEKKDVLKNIFQQEICQELLNFLYILVDKGRTRHFTQIMQAYKSMVDKEDGYSYGTIFSTQQLSADQLGQFEHQTSNLLQKKVKLENKLDAKLIGGIKILVDGRMIDASIRKRLDDLQEQII